MIYKKLLEFQKLGISIKKSSTNPHFRSSYADLNEVLAKVTKPLNDMGVVIVQEPGMHYGNEAQAVAGLYTTLFDTEDDTKATSFLPYVQKENAQKLGANNTYNRRYALVSMLALEDEDDDGNKASQNGGTKKEDSSLDFLD